MQTSLPHCNCIASLLVVTFVPLHITQYVQHHTKHCINDKGHGMREMGKKQIRWPSYVNPWLRFESLMNLFLGGNGMKSHPPVSDRCKRSMWLAIPCRSTSCFFLIRHLWKCAEKTADGESEKCRIKPGIEMNRPHYRQPSDCATRAQSDSYLWYLAGIYKCSLWLQ